MGIITKAASWDEKLLFSWEAYMVFLEKMNGLVWGIPALLLIVCVGIYICVRCRCPQIVLFPKAIAHFLLQFRGRNKSGGTSGYQALCTALAATVGTGNLIGVAGAIVIGGPGAIFWMWVFGFLGMGIKFAEVTLAVRYRSINKKREFVGGPMYIIRNGLSKPFHWLATVYCIFGLAASFGVGNATQVNAVVLGVDSILTCIGEQYSAQLHLFTGLVLAALLGVVLLGGAMRIGRAAEKVVPFAACGYLILSFFVILIRFTEIPNVFCSIITGAFSPKATTGGALGSAFIAMRVGASRGAFTNEAGMGTASIAHAGAEVEHPVEQGLMGIIEVFIDTIVICTLTALVILSSGITVPYGIGDGAKLAMGAFSHALGAWVEIPLSLMVICFASATILGWSLYGIRCAQFLFGENSWKVFACIQTIVVLVGALINTKTAWIFSELLNGLMLIPNMIALMALLPVLSAEVKFYKSGAQRRAVPQGSDYFKVTDVPGVPEI